MGGLYHYIKTHTKLLLGWLCVLLGFIGALLPIMPTTPFLILAAYFFSKSSPRMHQWVLNLKYLGPMVREWEESGVIKPKAKILCTIMIVALIGSSMIFANLHWGLQVMLAVIAISVLTFVWTRPSEYIKNDSSLPSD
jgi:uncharacterized membrane protein YbaN (DUF454 family)